MFNFCFELSRRWWNCYNTCQKKKQTSNKRRWKICYAWE